MSPSMSTRDWSTDTRRRERARSYKSPGETFWLSSSLYVIAILTGLTLPGVAVVFYFGIAVYLVVPFREIKRFILRRS